MGEFFRFKPMTLVLALLVAVMAALFPLLDEQYRPWNFAAFGAIGLFVAARAGLLPALLLSLGSKLTFDLLNYRQHGYDADYLPSWPIYACFVLYAACGWLMLRRSNSPVRITGVALLCSLSFFLVTNFLSWQAKSLPYPETLDGLLQSYWMALPFYRGTFFGDLAFSGVLFGLHAALSRAYFPTERVALQPETVR
jgi:hypothetical protein